VNLVASLSLAFAAGALTILSPCILPLAPIVVASAGAKDRMGPVALGLGLALTFGPVGGALAVFGVEFGDSWGARMASAAIMVAIGAALVFPAIGAVLERRIAFIGRAASAFERLPKAGLIGQAAAGVALAFAWAPCAGPTLGAAFLLAARGGSVAAAMATMTTYALGAAAALIALGLALGHIARRSRVKAAGETARIAFGSIFALVGLAILTGLDHRLEAGIVAAMPDWLTAFAASL